MTFETNFCPSPWLHMRIKSSGEMRYCRWTQRHKDNLSANIADMDPETFFKEHMAPIRETMLQGEDYPACADCRIMEQHGKVSGRQKQMIKVGIDPDNFEQSFGTSTYVDKFKQSANNNGKTDILPVDWQIDLGSLCNSACVFCTPTNSSRLRAELHKLGLVDKARVTEWTDDPVLVKKFADMLAKTPRLHYLHFIGGETMMNKAFETILRALVSENIHTKCSIGFTTNLTIWDEGINSLLCKFKDVHAGLSIETMSELNDYLRWPSKIENVKTILDKYVELGKENNWHVTVRNAPTVFSISDMVPLYQHCVDNEIDIESCNFMDKPEFMRPSVLPGPLRKEAKEKLLTFVSQYGGASRVRNYNVRDRSDTLNVLMTDAQSWINYLDNAQDESYRATDLVHYITKLESSRHNNILEYLPEYENFLRSAGYR